MPPTPHDALFHAAFSRRENAAAELRAVLPEAVVERIDWSTLRLTDGHYVDDGLVSRQSDLLYTVDLCGAPAAVYVLIEHQSSIDGLMAFRMLRYMVRIWEKWLADCEQKGDRPKALPPIIPVLIAHVEGGWTAPVSMRDLYLVPAEVAPALARHLPSFDLLIDDLSLRTDEELRGRAQAGLGVLALLLLRHSRDGDELLARVGEWADVWRAVWDAPDGRRAFAIALRYVALAAEPATLQDLTRQFEPILGQGVSEVVMTLGERLIEQGRQQGRVEGEAKGRVEGEAKAQAEAVLRVFAAREMPVSDELRARIVACRDLAVLGRWIERAVTAPSAADAISEG